MSAADKAQLMLSILHAGIGVSIILSAGLLAGLWQLVVDLIEVGRRRKGRRL